MVFIIIYDAFQLFTSSRHRQRSREAVDVSFALLLVRGKIDNGTDGMFSVMQK